MVLMLMLFVCAVAMPAWAAIGNFSFAHTSDDHTTQAKAEETIAEFADPQPILLEPYKTIALPISFIIDTGDATEFGGADLYSKFLQYHKNTKIPLYLSVGNHDGTWRSLTYEVTQKYGWPYYSFDKNGCHFVILHSSGFQHPLPAFGPDQLNWLKKDLEKAGKDVPVFVAFHHPPGTSEFASRYDVDRLLDVLRPYNIAVIMYGHGHSANCGKYENFDIVQGGSTYGPGPAGYQVYSILDGTLRIAYKDQGPEAKATKKMLEKSLAPPAKRYPAINIATPKEGATYAAQIPVKVWIAAGKGEIKSAVVRIDGAKETSALELKAGGSFERLLPAKDLSPGAHSMKITFTGVDGQEYHKSTFFYIDSTRPRVLWRVQTGTASKTTPTIGADGTVYIGGYDGTVRAYTAPGKSKWVFPTKGMICGQILAQGDKVYVGSEDTYLYCLNAANGKEIWKFKAEEPIYSSPISDGKSVYFACGTGAFYSVDVATGKQNWKNSEAKYNIEIKPFLHDGKVYYGAWDTFIYCVNTADGKLVWKQVGHGSSYGGAARYYSPADCGPVVCNNVLFTPDRKYDCALSNTQTGETISDLKGIAGVGLSEDGKSVYLRCTTNKLEKVDSTGKTIWSVEVPAGMVPTAPTECNGIVYICGNRGTLSAVSASDGKLLWQYDTTPSLYVLAGVGASGTTAYVVGLDGSLTALAP